ncbi:TetR family transcriptional regulator [Nonomuraea sp. NPDC049714]|uniref:TetR family transcriptional regulator n=1 Tax=Nonomuraea sp. NPDC049714 TaxID=3364357 RepID=UPI00379EB47E
MSSGEAPTGLRERKKAGTRRALIEAALTLFERHGFEGTTVQQIADEVEVARRTFNRYFTSKEDVVLAHEDQVMEDLLAAIDGRPRSESPVTALRAVFHAFLTDPAWCQNELPRMQRVQLLLDDNPALMGENMRRFALREELLARHLAERAGAGHGFHARLLASTAFAALRIAFVEWARRPDADPGSCARLVDEALQRLDLGLDLPPLME